jgi:hypothetical protein
MFPWMPRRRLPAWLPTSVLEGAPDSDGAVALVLVAIVLLPLTILLAVFLFEWLLVLMVLPLATFASAFVGRPWLVVARQGSGFPERYVARVERRRYALLVPGWRASAQAIAGARREIVETGAPLSMGEPGAIRPRRVDLVTDLLLNRRNNSGSVPRSTDRPNDELGGRDRLRR